MHSEDDVIRLASDMEFINIKDPTFDDDSPADRDTKNIQQTTKLVNMTQDTTCVVLPYHGATAPPASALSSFSPRPQASPASAPSSFSPRPQGSPASALARLSPYPPRPSPASALTRVRRTPNAMYKQADIIAQAMTPSPCPATLTSPAGFARLFSSGPYEALALLRTLALVSESLSLLSSAHPPCPPPAPSSPPGTAAATEVAGAVECSLQHRRAYGRRGVEAGVHPGHAASPSLTSDESTGNHFRVARRTDIGSLAGAMAYRLRSQPATTLSLTGIGPYCAHKMVLGVCRAAGFVSRDGISLLCRSTFVTPLPGSDTSHSLTPEVPASGRKNRRNRNLSGKKAILGRHVRLEVWVENRPTIPQHEDTEEWVLL